MRTLLLGACLAALVAAPAQARWLKAESEHFVIYADDTQDNVAKFADQLERYHSVMEWMTKTEVNDPSPSNRLTIYVAGTGNEMRRLTGASKFVAGFYIPRAGSSSAFVQDIKLRSRDTDFSMTVLLHEYAHHFLISSRRHGMPRWLSEGAAEFYASARFPSDGHVQIGRPAQHRAGELFYGDEVPLENLFDFGTGEGKQDAGGNDFYGRSWLLFHYLAMGGERPDQLSAYQDELAKGTGSLDAARKVFGDLGKLRTDLRDYLRQRKIMTLDFGPDLISASPVQVHGLSDGMNEIMPLMISSKSGVSREEALELLPKVRAVAQRHPADAGVLAALAEAEFDAGNDAEAIAAADGALAIDPTQVNALVQKGFALFRQAGEAEDREEAYRAAMRPFNALNKVENDHPLPLIYFYRSYTERGMEPPELARHALERASELAPFDQGLTLSVGTMQAQEGKIAEARLTLAPLAADPHNGGEARSARALITALSHAKEGEPLSGLAISLAFSSVETAPAEPTED